MDGFELERPGSKYYIFLKKFLFHYMTGYTILNNYRLFTCFNHFIEEQIKMHIILVHIYFCPKIHLMNKNVSFVK